MALPRQVVVIVAFVLVDLTFANQHITALNHRVLNLERSMAQMRQMTNMMTNRISNLERLTQTQASTITTMAQEFADLIEAISESNAELRQRNAGLQTMLDTFERFFGSLITEVPEGFDRNRNALERIDSLNAFLGNVEANLVELRPDPQTVPANRSVDQEALGRALAEIENTNTELTQKVNKLQRRVDSTPEVAGDRSLTGSNDDIFTLDQCSDQIKMLGAQLNALTSAALDADSADRNLPSSGSRISETDRQILEGAVYGTARGVNSVRKSVFSVGSTSPRLGNAGEARTVQFDHVFVNKGNHWNASSNEYVAGITGYYQFFFSLRSYDGYFMGVTLMKNDEYQTAVYTEADGRNVMESQGVILHLEIGDRVWLRLGPSSMFAIHSDQYKYCTFSGFLVYKGL